MKTIRALAVISAVLLIFCISGVVVLCILPEQSTTTTTGGDKPAIVPDPDDVILDLTDDAGEDYLKKLYFVGDSTTYHFFKGGIDKSHILVPESLTLMLDSTIDTVTVGSMGLTIGEALADADAPIVIITVGVNGADGFTELRYKTYYKKLIASIRAASPDTVIILQSVFPVTKEYSDKNIGITNGGINRLNEWVKQIAADEGLKYLDTQSILKDQNGAQIDQYGEEDGVHMNAEAYREILKYIRTHAIEINQ